MRRRFIRQLRKNLREILKELDEGISVTGEWDALEIETSNENPGMLAAIIDRLASTPGIAKILQVDRHPLPAIEEIFQLTQDLSLIHI